MRLEAPIRPDANGRLREVIGVWPLLQWAFQREGASVDFDGPGSDVAMPGFGMEFVLIERARLGCKVDGGGRSPTHPDADAVADAVAVLPPERGGQRMALIIADLARAGQLPDCMIGARPRIVPVKWANPTQYARTAKTASAGRGSYVLRGRVREFDMRYCPVRVTTSADEIAAARRRYLEFFGALMHVRDSLRMGPTLSQFDVSLAMPPMQPWKKTVDTT